MITLRAGPLLLARMANETTASVSCTERNFVNLGAGVYVNPFCDTAVNVSITDCKTVAPMNRDSVVNIACLPLDNAGTVDTNLSHAADGRSVTRTATPDDGYVVSSVKVTGPIPPRRLYRRLLP